jgi:HEAT repeat protein
MRNGCRGKVIVGCLALLIGAPLTGCAPTPPPPRPAKKVLATPKVPVAPAYTPGPIDTDLQAKARGEIFAAAGANDPVLRAQALEALGRTRDADALEKITAALQDKAGLVRFAGAMAAGELKLKPLYLRLKQLTGDPDDNVKVAARYALHMLGDATLSQEIATLGQHPNANVRRNAAMALGLMENKSAVKVLHPMLAADTDAQVRLQAAESMWRLGDEEGLRVLVAATVSEYSSDQILAVLALAAPRDERVKQNLIGRLIGNEGDVTWVELQLASARALGMIGADDGFMIALDGATKSDPRQRALAALALGDIGRTDAQPALAKLLEDNNAFARIAAALAIRQLSTTNRPAHP